MSEPPDEQSEEQKEASAHKDAEERAAPSGKVVYEAILTEADDELKRTSSALFWSGLAAGLSMGFSLVTETLLRHHLPDAPWRPLVAKLGYSVGFIVVILGRQQLFTENTLTPILPLLRERNGSTFINVMRLWVVVLLANMIGAAIISGVLTHTPALESDVQRTMLQIGEEAMKPPFFAAAMRGFFAGWLIALLVWLLPYAESAHFFVILLITWVIGIGGFNHVVAGAVETLSLVWAHERSILDVLGHYLIPTLIGNIAGGVLLVAGLNHAQVHAGKN